MGLYSYFKDDGWINILLRGFVCEIAKAVLRATECHCLPLRFSKSPSNAVYTQVMAVWIESDLAGLRERAALEKQVPHGREV